MVLASFVSNTGPLDALISHCHCHSLAKIIFVVFINSDWVVQSKCYQDFPHTILIYFDIDPFDQIKNKKIQEN